MHQPIDSMSREERDALAMRQIIMRTFGDILQSTGLPPMTVLHYAAAAIGSVYREVADAHTWPRSCPCGWQPNESDDISLLQRALGEQAASDLHGQLATMPVAGRA